MLSIEIPCHSMIIITAIHFKFSNSKKKEASTEQQFNSIL